MDLPHVSVFCWVFLYVYIILHILCVLIDVFEYFKEMLINDSETLANVLDKSCTALWNKIRD